MEELATIEREIEELKSKSKSVYWNDEIILKTLNDCANYFFDLIGGESCYFYLASSRGKEVEYEYVISRKIRTGITKNTDQIPNKVISSYLGKDKQNSIGWVRLTYSDANGFSFTPADKKRLSDMAQIAALAIEDSIKYANNAIIAECNQLAVILAFVRIIEAKSKWTLGHSERVTNVGVMLLEAALGDQEWVMSIDQDEVYKLERWFKFAGLLHDLGKVGISDALIDKPGRLTDEEFEKVKLHPGIGGSLMDVLGLECTKAIVPMIEHHHENYDGTGYPEGLKGEEIPPGSRILKIADVYCAITEARPYRTPLAHWDAIEEIRRNSGRFFDPKLVEIFCKLPFENLDKKVEQATQQGEPKEEGPSEEQYVEDPYHIPSIRKYSVYTKK
ncbi:MAG TPA: HD domain-containing phosphohydrolase [Syntrophorhabdaceae bacterium]|nr:HD domain-containing phosphohydrolase [Syntrophorhabdaceae bacterium]